MALSSAPLFSAAKRYILLRESQQHDRGTFEANLEQLLRASQDGHTALAIADHQQASLLTYDTVGSLDEHTPLVLHKGFLAIRRHARQEQFIAQTLLQLATQPLLQTDSAALSGAINGLTRQQQRAFDTARSARLLLLTGGPGTGKTYTLGKIVQQRIKDSDQPLTIQLAAPTGKASARLRKALNLDAVEHHDYEVHTQTLHRLLGYHPQKQQFSYHQNRPIHADIVIVDEASMISTNLFYHLLLALPAHTQLIIAGDPHQLPAVDQGQVLADLCQFCKNEPTHALSNAWVELDVVQRFSEQSGIHQLSLWIQSPETDPANLNFWRSQKLNTLIDWQTSPVGDHPHDIALTSLPSPALLAVAMAAYQHYLEQVSRYSAHNEQDEMSAVAEAFHAFDQFRVLCALREGPLGVAYFNAQIERELNPHAKPYYHGQAVIITQNHYDLGLYNGDIGLILATQNSELYAYFPTLEGSFHRFSPSVLPHFELAYALTIHKSQGSEMQRVLLVLPEDLNSPILSKALVYTGITRTKSSLIMNCEPQALSQVIAREQKRDSLLCSLFSTE
ncbi:MAG: exodeoxyribonuclease V subunit alpha [Pseudomonadota bacterium]|nr:exodeoxyribonuclease V subunit alpha [Pseudomonadota bacterium]